MIQIYFHENQNKLQAIASGFVVISQWNFISTWKIGFLFFGKPFKVSQRKDSYGTILADLWRAVGLEVVQNSKVFYFRTVCLCSLCNSCARKIRNSGHYSKLFGMR